MPFGLNSANRPQLYRISQINRIIKAGRYPNTRYLAEELGVSPRTILRDAEFMRDSLKAPLDYCPRKRGYYYTEPGYTLGLVNLTEGELIAVYLGHTLLNRCKGTPYAQPVIDAFNKICCSLQETVNIDFGKLSDFITFDLEPLRGEEEQTAEHFAAIGKAIEKQRSVKLDHYSIARDSCLERLVDPYELRYHQGAWYMVGHCHLRGEIRIFGLDRIRALDTTTSTYTIPEDFNAGEYFQDTFQLFKGTDIHHVKIRFSAEQARWIRERQWHITQEIEEHPDGTLTLSMHTSGLDQVKRWVLSFGSHATVLEPPELVEAVKNEIAMLLQTYNHK